jgi:hypothetical protein
MDMSRWRMTFWLDDQNERDYAVGQAVVALKAQRKFVSTVRDGIRLIVDLRAGRTDVLFELFPHLADRLQPPPPAPDTSELERKIEQLQQAIVNNALALPAPPASYPMMQPALQFLSSGSGGIQPLTGFKPLSAPSFDDDDQDTVIIRRDVSADGKAANNFLDSLLGLQAVSAL